MQTMKNNLGLTTKAKFDKIRSEGTVISFSSYPAPSLPILTPKYFPEFLCVHHHKPVQATTSSHRTTAATS